MTAKACECMSEEEADRCVPLILPEIIELSKDKWGTIIVQELIRNASESGQSAMVQALMGYIVSDLAHDRFGNYAAQYCLEYGTDWQRREILTEITPLADDWMLCPTRNHVVQTAIKVADADQASEIVDRLLHSFPRLIEEAKNRKASLRKGDMGRKADAAAARFTSRLAFTMKHALQNGSYEQVDAIVELIYASSNSSSLTTDAPPSSYTPSTLLLMPRAIAYSSKPHPSSTSGRLRCPSAESSRGCFTWLSPTTLPPESKRDS